MKRKPGSCGCNACGQVFALTDDLVRQRQDRDIVYRYFLCPFCGAAYMVSALSTRRPRPNPSRIWNSQDIINQQYTEHFPRFRELFPSAVDRREAAHGEEAKP